MKRIIRLLFSRLGVTAMIVAAELALLSVVLLRLSAYSVYFLIALVAVNLLAFVGVVNSNDNPEYKLTWMGVILLVPFLGLVIYVLFHRHVMSARDVKRLSEVRDELDRGGSDVGAFTSLAERDIGAAGKAMAILDIDETAEVFSCTEARYYPSGEAMYADMLSDLDGAKKYVFLEYFIIEDGEMWRGIAERLAELGKRGVDVRVMYDDIGCMGKLPRELTREGGIPGVKVCRFARVSADLRNMRRNNNRDHRKLCIIDGRVAYTGGVNIADEYIGRCERFGVWKDSGIRLEGSAALGAVRLFLELWELAVRERGNIKEFFDTGAPVSSDGGYYIPFGSGPYPMYTKQSGKRAIVDIINQSQRYVYIMTPYLIIDYDLTEALRGAVCRGVEVKLITPGVPDKPIVKVMTKGAYPYLLDGGVEVYEYTPGFLHSKAVVSDDLYALVGTINLDYRSLVHHLEDAVWIYASPVVADIRRDFLDTLSSSHRMTGEEARLGPFAKLVRCMIRIFAPLL